MLDFIGGLLQPRPSLLMNIKGVVVDRKIYFDTSHPAMTSTLFRKLGIVTILDNYTLTHDEEKILYHRACLNVPPENDFQNAGNMVRKLARVPLFAAREMAQILEGADLLHKSTKERFSEIPLLPGALRQDTVANVIVDEMDGRVLVTARDPDLDDILEGVARLEYIQETPEGAYVYVATMTTDTHEVWTTITSRLVELTKEQDRLAETFDLWKDE